MLNHQLMGPKIAIAVLGANYAPKRGYKLIIEDDEGKTTEVPHHPATR